MEVKDLPFPFIVKTKWLSGSKIGIKVLLSSYHNCNSEGAGNFLMLENVILEKTGFDERVLNMSIVLGYDMNRISTNYCREVRFSVLYLLYVPIMYL